TLELYRYAKAHGIAVFFITGRYEPERVITETNLNQAGFHDWNGLALRPLPHTHESPAPWKTREREHIENMGYTIVLNMGDQVSDLSGGHAQKTFKLPNPYYLIP